MKPTEILLIEGKECIICNICKIQQPILEFIKDKRSKCGVVGRCKGCIKRYLMEYNEKNADKRKSAYDRWKISNPDYSKKYRERFPELTKERNKNANIRRKDYYKEYNLKNKEAARKRSKIHYEKNKERKIELRKKNREISMPKIRETGRIYVKNRVASDPLFKMLLRLRCRTKAAFRAKRWHKNSHTEELLGCSFGVAKNHIEAQLKNGMDWNNHGNGEGKWNIDHIVPLASAKTVDELILLCRYTNLQPLWSIDNFRKSDSMPDEYKLKIAI